MHIVDELLRLSATDLANHLGCVHLSNLNLAVAQGRARRPGHRDDPVTALLEERGREHERAYLTELRKRGTIAEIAVKPGADGAAETLAAMRDGADVIYQAPLAGGRWYGRADFLLKTGTPSELGPWSYEVVDAKLATETRAGTVLQLCVYSELLAELQGARPERASVVAPHHGFKPEPYRLAEYSAYYRLVKRRLEAALEAAPPTYPEPAQHCDVCSWWSQCNARRRADDHLCFVAGIHRTQIKELRSPRFDINTLEKLGELKRVPTPQRGSREALTRVRDQAAIQLKARRLNTRQHEILMPFGAEHGFNLLPMPSPHDLFLDLEGDRLAADGGREYLYGVVDTAGTYTALWATNPEQEKRAFEQVVDRIIASHGAHPDMHVYHFAPYEPAAFKRLSGRYATRETELDRILRAELFVDLYSVVKHSLKASVESYSIKELEPFFGLNREQDLRQATASRRALEWAIERREDLTTPELVLHMGAVERYNREDCVSARGLRDWLEQLRAAAEREPASNCRAPRRSPATRTSRSRRRPRKRSA